MKIKSDFVTNSSSSSFIVAFVTPIKEFDDVKDLIGMPDKATQVLKDCKEQKIRKIKTTKSLVKEITTELSEGYTLDFTKYQRTFCEREGITNTELYKNHSWVSAFYKEFEAASLKECSKRAIKFIKDNEGGYLYIFHYGDDDGLFMSEMEHGGTFSRLPHITISKH